MRIRNKLLLICLLLISIFVFSACDLINQNTDTNTDEEFKLIYKADGNGYIVCEYDNNARIKKDTAVSLQAMPYSEAVFVAWYDEANNEVSKDSTLNITMTKKWVLIAKFKTEKQETPPEEDPHTKLSEIEENKEAFIKATVLVTFKNGFLIKDASDYAIVYLGHDTDYSCGDVIEFKGTPVDYKGRLQFTELNDCKRVGYELLSYSANEMDVSDLDLLITNPQYGLHVKFEGTVVEVSGYYDIQLGGNNNYIYPYNYDKSLFPLENYVGKTCKFTGYVWGLATSKNVYFILEDVDDNSQSIGEDGVIYAYFNADWTNPQIIINNNKTYNMTKSADHYEYKPTGDVNTVIFQSGSLKTETLDFDEDSYTFVLGNQRYNGLYDGYFTDLENVNNEVTKITTLELNDMHGYIEREDGVNGLSSASYLINLIRNEDDLDNVVLVANGDMFQGTALSNLTRGRSVVEIMNAMEFDFMGIGNHEFDWGLEEIYKFFDGDKSNGEANFPLVNSNVYFKNTDSVVVYDGYNVLESLMLEKEGVKIGVVSCIGMLKSSILATRTENYDFESIVSTATPLCKALRDSGADIILVNLHDGSSSTVSDYTTNTSLSSIKYKGKNLVDIIVNGHTHYNQFGYIERDGADVPITQAGCNCQYVGEMCVYYDHVLDEVVYSRVTTYNLRTTVGTNYDPQIEAIVNEKYNEVKTQIEEKYCTATQTVTQKNQLFDWAAQVMLTSVGADVAISNTGGIRSTGRITNGEDITLSNMFEIIPFDNEIIICDVLGSTLKTYLKTTSNYYGLKNNIDVNSLSNSYIYKVAVIDYVYYGSYFMANSNPVNTHVIYRDALIEDLKLRTTFNVSRDKSAVIGLLYNN